MGKRQTEEENDSSGSELVLGVVTGDCVQRSRNKTRLEYCEEQIISKGVSEEKTEEKEKNRNEQPRKKRAARNDGLFLMNM
jgi:hypothetical protein